MKDWQFNVLFLVGVGGAILMLIGPDIGLEGVKNPTATAGIGLILTYILYNKERITSKFHGDKKKEDKEENGSDDS